MKIFCERLKELRVEKGLSAIQLGQELGVKNSTIIRWENGVITPSIDHLYNIAKFFGVTADFLIGLEK